MMPQQLQQPPQPDKSATDSQQGDSPKAQSSSTKENRNSDTVTVTTTFTITISITGSVFPKSPSPSSSLLPHRVEDAASEFEDGHRLCHVPSEVRCFLVVAA